MTAVEDIQVAIRTLTDLTTMRARSPIAELRDAAELKAALRRAVPEMLAMLESSLLSIKQVGTPSTSVLALARLINAQPEPHNEAPC